MGQFNIACRAAVGDGQVHLAAVHKIRRVDLHRYLNVVVANLSLGQQLIVVAVIHDGDGRGIGCHGVDLVAFVVGRGAAVARRIGAGHAGIDGLVGIRRQVTARHQNGEAAIGVHLAGVFGVVDGQGDDVAFIELARHGATNWDLLARFLGVDDVIGGDVGIQFDVELRRHSVDLVAFGVGRGAAVARRIGAGHAGIDGLVGIRRQVTARHQNGEAAIGVHLAGVFGVVDGQGDDVAFIELARHGATNWDLLTRFLGVDDVIGGDVGIQFDVELRRHSVDLVAFGVGRGAAVARRIGAGHAGIDGLVGIRRQVTARHQNGEAAIGVHLAGVFGVVDGQGDDVAFIELARHGATNWDLLTRFLGVDDVIGGDVGIQFDAELRRHSVDLVAFGVGRGAAVARRIGAGHAGIDGLVGIRRQVTARHQNGEAAIGVHLAGVFGVVDGQGDDVACLELARHGATNWDLLTRFLGVDDVIGGDVGIQFDAELPRHSVDLVAFGVGRGAAVARRIGAGHAGIDGLVGIRRQVTARHQNGEAAIGVHLAGVFGVVDGQGDDVAFIELARHGATNWDLLTRFLGVDDVIGGDVGIQFDVELRRHSVDLVAFGVGRGAAVARRIGAGHAGIDGLVGIRRQVTARHQNGEAAIGVHLAGVFGVVDGQGDDVAFIELARHGATNWDLLTRFLGVDDVIGGDVGIQFDVELRRHSVDLVAFGVGRGAAVARRIGAGHAGIDGLVGIRRQVTARHQNGEAAIGVHLAGVFGVVDGQGDDVAFIELARHGATNWDLLTRFLGVDDVIGGDVGIQFDVELRRHSVDLVAFGVGRGAAVARRIGAGHAGIDGLVGIRRQVTARHQNGEAAIGVHLAGVFGVVDGQGDDVAFIELARHGATNWDLLTRFLGVDDVIGGDVGIQFDVELRRHSVDLVAFGVGRGAAVARRIGAGHAGIDGLVGIRRQVTARHQNGEAAIGVHLAGVFGVVDGQGDDVAFIELARHGATNWDLLTRFLGVDDVIGGDVGIQFDVELRRHSVDLVAFGVGRGAAVARRIGAGHAGIDGLVGIRRQVTARHQNGEAAIGVHLAGVFGVVDGQGDDVACLELARHGATNWDLLTRFLGVDDVIGGDVGIQFDVKLRRHSVDLVAFGVGRGAAVARRIGAGHAGIDGLVGIRRQVTARHQNGEAAIGVHLAGVFGVVDGQGDDVAFIELARHGATNWDLLTRFLGVDDVIGGDVGIQFDAELRRHSVDLVAFGVGRGAAVARRIGAGHAGIDGLVGIRRQVTARHQNGEAAIGVHLAGVFGVVDGQGDDVAFIELARHGATNWDLLTRFLGVDDVIGGDVGIQFDAELRRHSVDLVAFGVGRGAAVARRIGAGHAGIDGLVGIRRQVTARHQNGEAAIGVHLAGVFGVVDGQGDDVAFIELARHGATNWDLLTRFLGVDDVIGGDVGIQFDVELRRHSVDLVAFGVDRGAAVARRIGAGHAGIDGLVGIRRQVTARHQNGEAAIGVHLAGVFGVVDGQGDDVAFIELARHGATNWDLLTRFLGVDDVIGGDVGIQFDVELRRHSVDLVAFGVGRGAAVARRIGAGHAGIDGLVGIRRQVTARHQNGEAAIGVHLAGVFGVVDGQGDDVACLELARHGAANWDLLTRFLGVDDVIGGDVGIQFDAELRRHSVDLVAFAVGGGGAVARRIGAGHAGIDGAVAVGRQVAARHQDGEAAIGPHRTGERLAVDGQGDDVACLELARHGAADWDLLTRFLGVDDVIGGDVGIQFDVKLRRHSVDLVAFGVGRGAAVARRIGAGHAGIDGLVGIRRQVTARHQNGEAAIGVHLAGVFGVVDGQGDDVAFIELARHGATNWDLLTRFLGVDDVIGGDVGIQFDAELRRHSVDLVAFGVGRGAAVARRIGAGHAGIDGLVGIRRQVTARHQNGEAAIGVHLAGVFGVVDGQGDDVAFIELARHGATNWDLLTRFLGVDDVIGGDVGIQFDAELRRHSVDLVAFGVGRGAAVARRIGAGHAGIDGLVGIRRQVTARHQNGEAAIGVHLAGVFGVVDGQGDDVAFIELARHGATNWDLLTRFLGVDDVIGGDVGIQFDVELRRHSVDLVAFGVDRGAAVARRIGAGHAGIDGLVGIRRQVTARHQNGEAAIGVHLAGVFGVVDGQGDDVAFIELARHGATNWDLLTRFLGVDDVIGGDVGIQFDVELRRHSVDLVAFGVGRGAAVARRIGAGHAGIDGLVGIRRQVTARHQNGEAAIGVHLAGVFGVVDGQGDDVACLELARHGAANWDLLTRFLGVDDVIGGDVGIQFDAELRRHSVDLVAFAVGGGGAVARRIGAGHAGIDGAVAVGRQVAARHQDGEAAIGPHRTGERLAVDGQGDDVACLELARHGAADWDLLTRFLGVDDVIGGDVGIQFDVELRRHSVDLVAFGVGGGAAVARRIGAGHAGIDGLVGIRRQVTARHQNGEAAIGVHLAGVFGVVDGQGDDVAFIELARHGATNWDLLARFLGVDDVIGGDVGIQFDVELRRHSVDLVAFGVGRGAAVARRIGAGHAGIDGLVGIRRQVTARHQNGEAAIGVHLAGVFGVVDGQGDDVAFIELARHGATNWDLLTRFLGVDDVIGGDVGIQFDVELRRHSVDLVAFGVGRGAAVARRIGAGHAGIDGLVGIRRQVTARHQNGEAAIGVHLAGVFGVVDGQGDDVACLELARHGAANWDLLTRFLGVDDVIGGDVGIQFDAELRRHSVDLVAFAVGGGGAVARRIGAGHAGIDGLVGIRRQVAARHQDGEAAIGPHRTGERLAVDGQGDDVACLELARHGAADWDLLTRFLGVDDVIGGDVGIQFDVELRRHSVDLVAFGVGGGAAVARRIGAGHAGIDGLVGIRRQVTARHQNGEAAIGVHLAGVFGVVDGQGDDVACLELARHGATNWDLLTRFLGVDDVIGGDVGIQFDAELRRHSVDLVAFGVGRGAAVARRIGAGHAGIDGLVGIRRQVTARHQNGEAAIGVHLAGVFGVVDGQGDDVAFIELARHGATNWDLLTRFLGVDDVIGGDVGIQFDVELRRHSVDLVAFGVGRGAAVARRIGAGHAGIDGLVGIRRQVTARHQNGEAAIGVHLAGVFGVVDGQGDDVAFIELARHGATNWDLLTRFLGVDDVIGGDVGIQFDAELRRHSVDLVAFGVGRGAAVARRIGAGHAGIDGLVGIRRQVTARHQNGEAAIGVHLAGVFGVVDGQGDDVACLELARHGATNWDLLTRFLGVDDVIGGDVGIQFDVELRRHSVDLVAFGVGRGAAVVRRIGAGHAGIDGLVGIRRQVTARHQNGEAAIGVHLAGVFGVVDGQGDDVAFIELARHGATNWDLLTRFLGVDDVIGGDVGIQFDVELRRHSVDLVAFGVGRGAAVARRIGAGHAGIDGLVGIRRQVTARHQNGEAAIGVHLAGVFGVVDGQGDDVAFIELARHGATNWDLLTRFLGVDDVIGGDVSIQFDVELRRHSVDLVAFGVGRGAAVARRIGAGHAGIDGLVGIRRQVTARHQNGEAAIGVHLAGVFGVVDGQGDDVACLELARHGAANWDLLTRFLGVDDVIGGDVGIQFDAELRRHSVDLVAFAVGGGSAVARRVGAGHAGIDGLVGIRRQVTARHQNGEAAIGVHRAGERLAIDGQGDDVACLELARHGAADWDLLTRFLGVDDVIGGDVGIQFDAELRRHSVDLVAFGVGGGGAVARRIGHGDLGCDAVATHQFVGGGAGAKAQLAIAQIHHLGG